MGGLCLMVGVLAAVGVGWTAACVAQPELLGAESLFSVRLLTALLGALLFGGVGLLCLLYTSASSSAIFWPFSSRR